VVEKSGDGKIAKTPVNVKALYEDKDGEIRSVKAKFEAATPLSNETGGTINANVSVGKEIFGAATDGAIEIRIPTELKASEIKKVSISPLSSVKCEEVDPAEYSKRPSLTITRTKRSDTLWGIAKKYRATISDIKNANLLESENVEEGSTLIIPKKR